MTSKSVISGTAGGTMLTILCNIEPGQFGTTILLAAVGATVSYLVSLLLREIDKWFKG